MVGKSHSSWANGGNRKAGAMPTGSVSRPRGDGGTRQTGLLVAATAICTAVVSLAIWWTGSGEVDTVPAKEALSSGNGGERRTGQSPSRRPGESNEKAGKNAIASDSDGKRPAARNATQERELNAPPPSAAADASPSNTVEKKRAKVFGSGLEQVAAWIFTTRLGDTPPPLPSLGDMSAEDLEAILSAPNPVLEGDSEKTADAKRTVAEAKRALGEYLKSGGDVQGFFAYYHGLLREAHDVWRRNQAAAMRAFCENPEEAPALVRELDAEMAERGIRAIVIPPKYRDFMGSDE